MVNQSRRGDYPAVQLILNSLDLEVAHEHPGQGAAEQQAHGDNAGGGGQETNSEGQLSASSSRYPTPQTVSMLGSVMAAAASFSRSC